MILHVVIFRWNDDVVAEDIDRLERDLRALAADVPAVSFQTGRDGGFRPGTADFVVVAGFRDEAGLRRYLEHPDHHRMLDDYARAMVAHKESVQTHVADPTPA